MILLLILPPICFAIMWIMKFKHDQSIWAKTDQHSFFGSKQWTRKYSATTLAGRMNGKNYYDFDKAPSNWYYKLFSLKYKERFPGSATILIHFTDAFHLAQFIAINCYCIVITYYAGWPWWIELVLFWGGQIIFQMFYGKILRR